MFPFDVDRKQSWHKLLEFLFETFPTNRSFSAQKVFGIELQKYIYSLNPWSKWKNVIKSLILIEELFNFKGNSKKANLMKPFSETSARKLSDF